MSAAAGLLRSQAGRLRRRLGIPGASIGWLGSGPASPSGLHRAGRVAAAVALLTAGLAGCAGDDIPATDSETLVTAPQSVDLAARPIVKDLLPDDRGAPPEQLVIEDLVAGSGTPVEAGATVAVHFVGAVWSSGAEFDATWNRGQTFTFTIGEQRVIEAWDVGLMGAREGTRRVLIAPPQFAYGDAGTATIPPGETVVFIVDVLTVNP